MDVKTLCLGVLYLEEASGYEIKKRLQEGPFGQFQASSFGSIYPALNTLCADGAVSVREESQTGRPDKRVYSITPEGRHALLAAVTADPGPDRIRSDFLFVMFFGDLLSARRLDALFAERVRTLRERLDEMDRSEDEEMAPGQRFVRGMARAIMQAQIDHIEAHGHELIAAALEDTPLPRNAGSGLPAAPTIPASSAD